jgi:3-oxoacyl-[acyl-carrier protein] reductase
MTADEPRTAFITGAAQGLGEGFARAFLVAGYRVALADVSERVRDTAARLDPSGAQVLPLLLDVRDRAAFEAAFAAALARFGVVNVMINNAARTVARSVWDIDQAEWDDVLAVNLRGVFFGCTIAGAGRGAARDRGAAREIGAARPPRHA